MGAQALIIGKPSSDSKMFVPSLNTASFQNAETNRVIDAHRKINTVRLVVFGKSLPPLEDAVRIGELMREAAMGLAKRIYGEERIPWILSGHSLPESNRHGHAFYLPEDADGDGRIDHLLIHAPNRLDRDSLRALASITRLWNRDGGEWQVLFEGQGAADRFGDDCRLVGKSKIWRSVTPYLHPWYRKKNFGIPEQIRRECRERGWPEPEGIELLPEIEAGGGRKRRPIHFHRFRSKRGLIQPDTHGSFVELTFAEPVRGPLALGFGCHFGLGLFAARDSDQNHG